MFAEINTLYFSSSLDGGYTLTVNTVFYHNKNSANNKSVCSMENAQ